MDAQKVNLNTATTGELAALPGIGATLAARIVAYREAVHPFEEAIEITAVPGIAERTYRAIASRLTVAAAALPEGEPLTNAERAPDPEAAALTPPDASLLDPEQGPAEVMPQQQPVALSVSDTQPTHLPTPLGALHMEQPAAEGPPASARASSLRTESTRAHEAEPALENDARGFAANEPEPAAATREAGEFGPPPARPPSGPTFTPPPTPRMPQDTAPSRDWRGCGGLVTAAFLGGLFGALLALLVIAGINGTLDFAQAGPILNLEADVARMESQADLLGSDVAALRQRLDQLEGLTTRMDAVEGAVDALDGELAETQVELQALARRADDLETEVIAARAAMERFDQFLDGLRNLLFEFQGAPPTATPTPAPLTPPPPTPTPWVTPEPGS